MKKRIISALLLLCLLLSAASCSKSGEDISSADNTNDVISDLNTPNSNDETSSEAVTDGEITDENTDGAVTDGESDGQTTTKDEGKEDDDIIPEDKENAVSFSQAAGFYNSAFKLTLTAEAGYEIYYTNDGSDPRKSGVRYTVPIEIKDTTSVSAGPLAKENNRLSASPLPTDKLPAGTVIKAYAKKDGIETQVVTNSYFVIKNASRFEVPFVSVSIKPSDFVSASNGIYYTVMADPFGKKERRDTYVEIFEKDGKRVCTSYAELAMNGNGSLGLNSKSMRLYFKNSPYGDSGDGKLRYDIFLGKAQDGVTEFKRLILRNSGNDCTGAHLRDGYAQRLCSSLNAPVMAYRAAFLFVDGEFWGVYNIRERFDTKYFKEHFDIPEEDLVMIEAPSPLTTNWATNEPYILNDGEEGDEKPFHELVQYILNHDMSDDNSYKYVCSQLDTDNLIDFFCGSIYLANNDWPSNNVKVYRSKNITGTSGEHTKWRFVFSDMDMTCSFVEDYNRDMFTHAINNNTVAGSIFSSLLENSEFRKKFVNRMTECATTIFAPDKALAVLDEMTGEIDGVMQYHYKRWLGDGGSTVTWNANVQAIRAFINNRGAVILRQLSEKYGTTQNRVMISADNAKAEVTVSGKKLTDSVYEAVCGEDEILKLSANVKNGYVFKGYAVTERTGSTKLYTSKELSLNIKKDTTISVLTAKANFMTTPTVVAGSRAVFALDANGDLYAWGENELSQLLVYTTSSVKTPTLVASGVKKVEISRGGTENDAPQTVILTDSGDVYTVGCNTYSQLGRSTASYILGKVELSFKVKDISAGLDHMLLLSENGVLYGVGNNQYGQLGATSINSSSSTPIKLASNVAKIAAGRRHTLYITTDGKLYALGDNRWSKIASSAPEVIRTPYLLASDAKEVYAGQHNSLYINNSNELYYFGWRSVSSFDSGTGNGKMNKIADNVKKASVMDEHIIYITHSGEVYGVGYNNYGQISHDMQKKTTPTKLASNCVDASAGTYYSVYLSSSGKVTLHGSNKSGVMGNGTQSSAYTEYSPITIKVK